MEALTKAQHAAAESLYKQAQSPGGTAAAARAAADPASRRAVSRPAKRQGEVIDAEVVDEK